MKRSEMIKKIEEIIDDTALIHNHVRAERLLNAIEDAGMMPPFCTDIYYKTWRDGGSGYVWEKEEFKL